MYLVSYLLSGRTSLMVKNNTSLEINDLPQDQMLCVFPLISESVICCQFSATVSHRCPGLLLFSVRVALSVGVQRVSIFWFRDLLWVKIREYGRTGMATLLKTITIFLVIQRKIHSAMEGNWLAVHGIRTLSQSTHSLFMYLACLFI